MITCWTSATYPVLRLRDGAIAREDVPALSALNMRLRDDYVEDAQCRSDAMEPGAGAGGVAVRLCLPHVAFNRRIGEFAAIHAGAGREAADGSAMGGAQGTMLPAADDNRFVESLMRPVHTPGAFAS